MTDLIHETYLPFAEDEVLEHFAEVSGRATDRSRFLSHFTRVVSDHRAWQVRSAHAVAAGLSATPGARDVTLEKDERFWTVAALMGIVRGSDPRGALATLLRRAYPHGVPASLGVSEWEDLLTGELQLRFEANLPSPTSYRDELRERLTGGFLLPTQRTRAAAPRTRLEGQTKADAVIVASESKFAVIFESKVLSDVSTTVSFDAHRNQLARLLDVGMDDHSGLVDPALKERDPRLTCVVLLTPETFRDDPTSRLYGWLYSHYRSRPEALHQHLPHRDLAQCADAAERLGWATWEDVRRVRPDTLPWVDAAAQR